ncbi:peptide ABC transporter substrate-binding protein [Stomatobaculum longum]|uniref:peptide ABC transporter substrate-binding protein n=1 Tax=Stomatobaculum longum TaxID=796942 RepID=UPI002806373A|nr:peptide ABC transporter substrate-binding protein [Stomatobaculum longum]
MMKKRWKQAVSLLLVSAMAVGLAACGASSKDGAASAGATTTAANGGSASGTSDLNVMLETPVEALDPQQAVDGTSFEVIADYTDGLYQMDKDGEAVPALAADTQISEDGLSYTFKIRDDAKWSNGEPVTAQDFVFAWQRAVDPKVASEYAYMLSDVGQIKNAADIIAGKKDKSELGVTAVDDKTLKVELNVQVPYFLGLMYFPTFYPVNQKFFESCGDTFATSPETTLSNGAFILDSYEPAATTLHLKKNPDYYDAKRVKLTGINYQVIQDSQQALMSYQTGAVDTTLVNGEQVDQVKDDPTFHAIAAGYLWYVVPNISKVKELSNLNVRLAMTMAINRESITTDVLKDGSIPTYTAVPIDFATGPDGSDFAGDQKKFENVCRFDAAAAADYWKKGLAELGVSSISLNMIVDADDAPQKVAQVLKEQWETTLPGLTVNLVVEPKKQRVQDMQDGNFEVGLTRWGPDYADPMTYLGMWGTGNSNNYGEWSNADYDAILAACTTGDLAMDAAGRWAKLLDGEKIVMDNAVIFPLYTQSNAQMISSKVTGIDYHPVALNRVYKDTVKSD